MKEKKLPSVILSIFLRVVPRKMKDPFILPSSKMDFDTQFGLELNSGDGDRRELKLGKFHSASKRDAVEELSGKLEAGLWKNGQGIFFFLIQGCLEFGVKLYVLL